MVDHEDSIASDAGGLATPEDTELALDDELRRRILAILRDELEPKNPAPMQLLLGQLLIELGPDELTRALTKWLAMYAGTVAPPTPA